MSQTVQRYRNKRSRFWRSPFEWFDWFFKTKPKVLFRYDTASGRETGTEAFARASTALYLDQGGTWQSAASGVKRDRHYLNGQGPTTLLERAATNDLTYCRDLSNAAWTATNVTVAAATGADGVASAGSRLTATAGNGTVIRASALVHASAARSGYLSIKRVTGTGNIQVTLDNGSTWTTITVTDAYTRLGKTQTLANSQFGIRIVTSGDAVDVDFCQNEDGTEPTSPIATTSAAVTRAADELDFAFAPTAAQLAATGVTIYEDFIVTAGGSASSLVTQFLYVGSTGADVTDCFRIFQNGTSGPGVITRVAGANASTSAVTPTLAIGDRLERLTTVDPVTGAAQMTVSVNGGALTVGTKGASGGWPTAFTTQKITLTDEATAARKGGLNRSRTRVAAGIHSMATMRSL